MSLGSTSPPLDLVLRNGSFALDTSPNISGLDHIGPRPAFNEYVQGFLVVLYTCTALLALGGNITAIWVLMVGKRSSKDLRTFLVNLAFSDITMALFSIPFTYTSYMLDKWVFHPYFCPFVVFMTSSSVFVSVYTLTAIGIDRYFAIMNPLNSRWTKSRSRQIVAGIWVTAFLANGALLVYCRAEPVDGLTSSEPVLACREDWPTVSAQQTFSAIIFTITFALPMCILVFTYASIGWKMLNHTAPGNANVIRDVAQLDAKMKVIKMLAVVVILFVFCWLPLQAYDLLYRFEIDIFDPTTTIGTQLQNSLFFLCHWLAMANSFLNPIIYCFMSDNFRTDLKHIFLACCPVWRSVSVISRNDSTCCESSFRTTTFLLKQPSVRSDQQNQVQPINGQFVDLSRYEFGENTKNTVFTSVCGEDEIN